MITLYSELFPPQKRKVNDGQKIIHFFFFQSFVTTHSKSRSKGAITVRSINRRKGQLPSGRIKTVLQESYWAILISPPTSNKFQYLVVKLVSDAD